MRYISSILLVLFTGFTLIAQDESYEYNPLQFWEGQWILKNTSITPEPANDNWKSEFGLNEFIPILNGQGMHRIAKSGTQRNEAYMFFDRGSSMVYVMSIDPAGYVWESSAIIDESKDTIIFVGTAKNDSSTSIQAVLKILNENEVTFEQQIFQNGEEISEYKGLWLRIPEVD